MRITRTAATLGLLLAAAACGTTTLTEPDRGDRPDAGRKEMVSPASATPRMGGNYVGSGH
jgi:hypothetical protein